MSRTAWAWLKSALRPQPAHAADALTDLRAVTVGRDDARGCRLPDRVAQRAPPGTPLHAAPVRALGEVLDDRRDASR